jgi:hypothetical protein
VGELSSGNLKEGSRVYLQSRLSLVNAANRIKQHGHSFIL